MFPVVVLLVTNFVLLVEVCPPAPKVDIAFEMSVFELSVFAGAVTGSAGGLGLVRGERLDPAQAIAGAVSLAASRAAACGRLMQCIRVVVVGSHCSWLHFSDRRAYVLHSDFVALYRFRRSIRADSVFATLHSDFVDRCSGLRFGEVQPHNSNPQHSVHIAT